MVSFLDAQPVGVGPIRTKLAGLEEGTESTYACHQSCRDFSKDHSGQCRGCQHDSVRNREQKGFVRSSGERKERDGMDLRCDSFCIRDVESLLGFRFGIDGFEDGRRKDKATANVGKGRTCRVITHD